MDENCLKKITIFIVVHNLFPSIYPYFWLYVCEPLGHFVIPDWENTQKFVREYQAILN